MLKPLAVVAIVVVGLLGPVPLDSSGSSGSSGTVVTPSAGGRDEAGAVLEVTGFAYGSLSRATLRRDAHALSTLGVDGVGLSPDGRDVADPADDQVDLARAARTRGLRTELMVHNFSDRLGDFDPRRAHRLLASPAAIADVSDRLAALVAAGGWDGVNVDLELVPAGDAAGLVALCHALQDAMPPGRSVTVDMSAAGSPAAYRDRGYDLAGLAEAVDRIELMAYDQHGPGWSDPGPVGALGWQRAAVAAMRRVVPADKIDLGVAAYGYSWRTGRQGAGTTVSPAWARATARRAGVRPVWHADAGEWSVRLPGGSVVWWSDARSVRHRAALARELGLHGLALWRLGPADPL